jgi:hypothetical protein
MRGWILGVAAGAVLLPWSCGGQTDSASVTAESRDGSAASRDGSSSSSSASSSSSSPEASATSDGTPPTPPVKDASLDSDATTVTADSAAGECVLPANTCDDYEHLRIRNNLSTADGGCSWQEQVVDCHDLGWGDLCINGVCSPFLR